MGSWMWLLCGRIGWAVSGWSGAERAGWGAGCHCPAPRSPQRVIAPVATATAPAAPLASSSRPMRRQHWPESRIRTRSLLSTAKLRYQRILYPFNSHKIGLSYGNYFSCILWKFQQDRPCSISVKLSSPLNL